MQERRIRRSGALEETEDLSSTGRDAAEPQVAVGPDGTATVVWKRFDGYHFLVKERRVAADGTVEAAGTHTLSATGRDAVEPQVAVGPDGTATVVWSRFDGEDTIVQERRVAADDSPAPDILDLSATGQNAVEPDVAAGPDGSATAVWARSDGDHTIVQERRVGPAGEPDPAANSLSTPGGDAAEPQVAVGSDGTAIAVWERFDGSSFVIQARRLTPAGSPGPAASNLSATDGDAAEPQVEIAPDESATIVWAHFDGSDFVIQRRDVAADGTPAPEIVDLSAPGRGAGAPQLALGAHTTVIWRRFDGAGDVVQGVPAAVPGIPAGVPGLPAASLSPAAHDFGEVAVGAERSEVTFDLISSGSAPLSVSSVSVSGADPGQFDLAGTGACLEAPLAPGYGCRLTVAFEPSETGELTGTLEILSDDASSPARASLSGIGIPNEGGRPTPSPPAARPRTPRPVPATVSNAFSIGRPARNRRLGTARLPVHLPGPGTLIAAGSLARTARMRVARPRTVRLTIRARGQARRRLDRRGSVAVWLTLTFAPRGGEPGTRRARLRLVKLRRRAHCRHRVRRPPPSPGSGRRCAR